MTSISHLVNPVAVPESSDLHVAQPITFESMRRAQAFSAGSLDVELVAALHPEDRAVAPAGFRILSDLEQSVLDHGDFPGQRKLPLVRELLALLRHETTAEHLIYTNVDIALQPHFYAFVAAQIDRGLDYFVIHRRTISRRWTDASELPNMYAELGEDHPGTDCFVFHRRLLDGLDVGEVCLGARHVAAVLSSALLANATNWATFERQHLTFHLGDDRRWDDESQDAYGLHNARQSAEVTARLLALPHVDGERRAYIEKRHRRALRFIDRRDSARSRLPRGLRRDPRRGGQ